MPDIDLLAKIASLIGGKGLVDKLVLPKPKCPTDRLSQLIDEAVDSPSTDLCDVLPLYQKIAEELEKCGYKSHAELLNFCFGTNTEIFCRTITEENGAYIQPQIKESLDQHFIELGDSINNRDKITSYETTSKIFYDLVSTKKPKPLNLNKLTDELLDAAKQLGKFESHYLKEFLGIWANRTFDDRDATFAINYLNHLVFNKYHGNIPDEIPSFSKNIKELASGIKKKNRILIYDSLGKIVQS